MPRMIPKTCPRPKATIDPGEPYQPGLRRGRANSEEGPDQHCFSKSSIAFL